MRRVPRILPTRTAPKRFYSMKIPTLVEVSAAVKALGYRWFEGGDYNLNIVGIRCRDTHANTFNDFLCVAFTVNGQPHFYAFAASTDPGTYYRENPANVDGTAILTTGQHRSLWKLGTHRGRYKALVQRSPVNVYRDNNRDQKININEVSGAGWFGINCHRANPLKTSLYVDKWGAGCQVLANPQDFDLLMALCEQSRARFSNGFTYTLINETDLARSAN